MFSDLARVQFDNCVVFKQVVGLFLEEARHVTTCHKELSNLTNRVALSLNGRGIQLVGLGIDSVG